MRKNARLSSTQFLWVAYLKQVISQTQSHSSHQTERLLSTVSTFLYVEDDVLKIHITTFESLSLTASTFLYVEDVVLKYISRHLSLFH